MMLFMTSGEPETETKETAAAEAEASSAGLTEEQQLQEDYRRFGIEGDDEESMDSIADVLSTFQDDARSPKRRTSAPISPKSSV